MSEEAFRQLLADPARYSAWAAKVRRRWELENVVWLQGFVNGKAVWGRERPLAPPDPEAAGPRFERKPKP